ncbi:MAG TPA: DUF72 domain-containing protein [Methanotrichaceae archaeon]|nr:DUF72 domain-containing protein [Methanotrichaceae archaeon]
MTVLVGCSGWSYDDWVGRFYPLELAKKKGEWFDYYASYFTTVEINSTFYRPPGDFQVRSWIKKAKAKQNFEYSAKMPQMVTHKSMVNGDVKKSADMASSFERTCAKPLAEEGLLGCVLLQLSPYFKKDDQTISVLEGVLDSLSCDEHDYAVEFRNRTWLNRAGAELDPDVRDALSIRNVANVMIDSPGFPITREETADHSYIRFHGRNRDIWYKEEKEDDYRLNRYDYLYDKKQLEAWVPRIRYAEIKAEKVRVYFNNHARSKAVRNAFLLMDMLLIEHKPKEIQLQDQYTLGSFIK